MAVHGFVPDASLDPMVAEVSRAAKHSGLELTVEIAPADDGIELRLIDVTPSHVRSLAVSLGASHPLVRFATCDIEAGSLGQQLNAMGLVVSNGALEEVDLTDNAKNILLECAAGGPVHEEEIVARGIAAALLERDPDAFSPAKILRCRRR